MNKNKDIDKSFEPSVRTWLRNWKTAKSNKWIKLNQAMQLQYQYRSRKDFREVLKAFCSIQKIFYKPTINAYYGVYLYGAREIYNLKLDDDFAKWYKLQSEFETAKNNPGLKISLIHGSYKPLSNATKKEIQNYQRSINFNPKITHMQGMKNSCVQRSINSALLFFATSSDQDDIKTIIGHAIEAIDRIEKSNSFEVITGKTILHDIIAILREAGFECVRYPSSRRRKKKRREVVCRRNAVDLLSNEFDKNDFIICQLAGRDYDRNHTVVITNQWIFDSNFPIALPLKKENLDKCCQSHHTHIQYKHCNLAYRFKLVDKQF